MDIVDTVTYDPDEASPEEVRQAFVNLLDPEIKEARLVVRALIGMCGWEDLSQDHDAVIDAKHNSLRNVILQIKKQLNMKPIEAVEPEGEEEYE
jgi:hypothetical protein|tara:strand:- start:121 stop:402 length:282 start_codon:yes stop_codon:yes gene_type:complete